MHQFIETSEEAIIGLPNFQHPENRYFGIHKNNILIGYLAIRPFNDGCNFGVHMVDKYKLGKSLVMDGLNFPLTLGYKQVFLITENKIVINFLDYMRKFGIYYICNILGKRYYLKNLGENI